MKCKVQDECIPFHDGIADCDACKRHNKGLLKPRKKPSMVRVKAWVWIGSHSRQLNAIDRKAHNGKGMWPGTITLDRKHLKGAK